MILDLSDLQKLSGYKRAADVKRWLHDNGVPFFVQPSGHPVTTLDAVNRAMCGASKYDKPDLTTPSKCFQNSQPDWTPPTGRRRARN
jgi:hypothetical protein